MTEISTLERKRLSDLHQIASQLGIKQYRKYRKPELAEMIYQVATEQAGQATAEHHQRRRPAPGARTGNGSAADGDHRRSPAGTAPAPVEEADGATPEAPAPRGSAARSARKAGARSAATSGGSGDGKQQQDRGGQQERRGGEETVPERHPRRVARRVRVPEDQRVQPEQGRRVRLDLQIKRFNLRRGDHVVGQIRPAREGEKYPAMVRIETVNGEEPQKGRWRQNFDDLTPLFPKERLRLEWKPNDIAPRVMDLITPIGKGQRGLIVSPPKAGKTTILKQIAQSIAANYPEAKLFVLLADERPEEVTDWQRSVAGGHGRRLHLRPARRQPHSRGRAPPGAGQAAGRGGRRRRRDPGLDHPSREGLQPRGAGERGVSSPVASIPPRSTRPSGSSGRRGTSRTAGR